MSSFRYTTGAYIGGQENWSFQAHPYVRAGSTIHCIGNECKRDNQHLLYKYNELDTKGTLFHYIPITATILVVMFAIICIVARRVKEKKICHETLMNRLMESDPYSNFCERY